MLIPGLGTSRHVFEPLNRHLGGARRLLLYDPRGIGDSEMSAPPWMMQLLADDAASVIEALSPDGLVDVFGASMGGVVAQQLVLDRPELVGRLVLAATNAGGRRLGTDPEARDRLMGKGARTPEEAYRLACTVLYSTEFQQTHPDFIEAQIQERGAHPVRPLVFSAQLDASRNCDLWDRLQEISRPTLVLHGTEDVVVPLADAKELAGRVPRSQHHWLEGCGHLFFH